VKVLALDYGRARTGVAVSDPTGTIARPVGVVKGGDIARIVELIREHGAERVVVGMPLTLRGQVGEQARETQAFMDDLARASGIEVVPFDERFTTNLAEQMASASAEEDARAAAHLLSSYLTWSTGAV
jgi:putative transcription antitermination factor YqgF